LAWDLYSVLHAYIGRPKTGLQCALFARHLGAHSLYRYYFDTSCLITASLLGRHEVAIRHGEAVLEDRPGFNSVLRFLTASYSHAGDLPKAEAMRQRLLRVEPSFSIETLRDARYPGLDTSSGQYFLRGLKKAGIREIAT
jgi:tetratricopeptide (TPR) repeat protein